MASELSRSEWDFTRVGVSQFSEDVEVEFTELMRLTILYACRDYEYLREAVSRSELKPSWADPIETHRDGYRRYEIPQLTGPTEEVIRPSRHFLVPPGFPEKPFQDLPPRHLEGFVDHVGHVEQAEWDSERVDGNALTQFDPQQLLTLIHPMFLRSDENLPESCWTVPRENPGTGCRPRKEGDEENDSVRKLRRGLVEVPKAFRFDADAEEDPLEEEERKQEVLMDDGAPQFYDDWAMHFWVQVTDWNGEVQGEDVDRWLKTTRSDSGGWESLAAFKIDWQLKDDELIAWFRAWLKQHRPVKVGGSGTGATREARLRLDLERLAALRLARSEGTAKKGHQRLMAASIGYAKDIKGFEKDIGLARRILRQEFDCEVR